MLARDPWPLAFFSRRQYQRESELIHNSIPSHSSLRRAAGVALGGILRDVGAGSDSLGSLVLDILGLVLRVSGSLLSGRGGTARAGEANNDGNDGDEKSTDTAGNLGNELDGLDGVLLGNGDEEVKLLLDEVNGVVKELEVVGRLGLLGLLGLVSKLGELLNGVLLLEGTTARGLGALGVGDGRGDPVTILLLVPVLGLLGLGVGNGQGLILKPVLGLGGLLINNLEGRVLIPVLGLLGLGVGDAGLVNPVLRLGVLGVVNLLLRVDGGGEVLEKGAGLDLLAVLLDDEGVVGVDNEGVELGGLDDASGGGRGEVLLLVLARLGVLVVEDEVDLVGVAALVRTKHDHVGGGVGELLLVKSLVLTEELELNFILDNEGLALVVNLLGELGRDGVVSSRVLDNKTLVALDALVDGGLLNSPFADVGPFLIVLGVFLGVGRAPASLPVVGELLKEGGLEGAHAEPR
ncbi:hypothetical protein Ct61P_01156 [Colletotrichum tofieldiae]|nr:hypothetical protein Ct61P_01156 [Colletotrichum tofieldiae]